MEPLLLSISDLEQYNTCPQRFMNSRIELRGRPYFSKALAVGTIVHSLLESRYASREVAPALDEARDKVFREHTPTAEQMEGVDKEVALLYPHLLAAEVPDRILAVEQQFTMRETDGYSLVGRWDAILGAMGGIWHGQHKTLAPNIDVERFSNYIQYSWHEALYEEAAKVQWPTERFMGTCLTVISKISKSRIASGENPMRVFWLTRRPTVQQKLLADIHATARTIINDVCNHEAGLTVLQNRKACLVNGWECTFKGICDGVAKLTDYDKREPRYTAEATGGDE